MKTLAFTAMGSRIFISLDTHDDGVAAEIKKAQQWFEDWEQTFSRFRANSELSIINRQPGKTLAVSEHFNNVMLAAKDAEEISDGLVTPAILEALFDAGYIDDFENLIVANQQDFTKALLTPIKISQAEFDCTRKTILLPFGTQIDFGGIAKGWSAHQTMERLAQFAPTLIDAGGDISISGCMSDGSPWPIGVADPLNPNKNLALLMLNGGGIATSGKDYRRWYLNHEPQHHIIDPRSMRPAQTDILTATVFTENVMKAETYAKTALILSSEEGKAWLDEHDQAGYLLVLENGDTIQNSIFIERQWKAQ